MLLGACASRDEFAALTATDSRLAALAREGEVPVAAVSAVELTAKLHAAGLDPGPLAPAVARLTTGGLAPAAAEAFVAAAVADTKPSPPDDFRSEQERFLFELLEQCPETAGRFRANQRLDFLHGHARAEADLIAAELKLVVEVDGGYFHLRPDSYRRDRRKDYAYQIRGYLVLRFLAEDVVPDFETILTVIREAVAWRAAGPGSEVPARG